MQPTATNFAPELLMPAGDLEKLNFAFAYGADAVYAGVPVYSLRARENGFNRERLAQGIEHAHRLGKKLYLTMNIYAHNSKVKGFLDLFCEMTELHPDAFIMTDAGLIREALRLRPEAVIHLSTQANATNWASVAFWRDFGVKRIILPRELSVNEIADIHEQVPDIELEAFVHGSVCIAYSGRCLISNYLNHRDANQGTCTNSCRWQYKLGLEKASLIQAETEQQQHEPEYLALGEQYYVTEPKRVEQRFAIDEDQHGTYLMNSKDLCAIELLKELRDSGVCSFKAEGRTKSPYYLAVTTRAYRQAIDDLAAGKEFQKANLLELFSTANRTLSTGFYLRKPREYGENFADGDSLPLTHQFAGRVLDYDREKNLALVEVKNKIQLGQELEWLSPHQTARATVTIIQNPDLEPIPSISGGSRCYLTPPHPATSFTLLRKRLA